MTTDGRPRRRTRRHAAAATRLAVAGLSTSATFGLVAVLGATADDGSGTEASTDAGASQAVQPVVATTPPPVVVIRRIHVPAPAPSATPSAASAATSSRPAAAPAAPAPRPARRTAPVVRSSAS